MPANPLYNPRFPRYLGLEWHPDQLRFWNLSGPATALAHQFRAQLTEDIGGPAPQVGASLNATEVHGKGALAIDIYDGDVPAPQPVSRSYYFPNEDCFGYNAYGILATGTTFAPTVPRIHGTGNGDTASTQSYIGVDEQDAPHLEDGYTLGNVGVPTRDQYFQVRHRFAIPNGEFAGKRILRVGFALYGWNYYQGPGAGSAGFACGVFNGANAQTAGPMVIDDISAKQWQITSVPAGQQALVQISMPYNPFNGLPWTIADVMQLKGSGSTVASVASGLQACFAAVNVYPAFPIITTANMYVEWVPENRVAQGAGFVDGTTRPNGQIPLLLSSPSGGSWRKQAGRDYTAVIRRMETNAYLSQDPSVAPPTVLLPVLSGDPLPTRNGLRAVQIASPAGDLAAQPATPQSDWYAGLPDATTNLMLFAGGGPSADSQVYTLTQRFDLSDSPGLSAQQEFTPTGGLPYGSVRALVKWTNGEPASALIATLRTRVGGTVVATGQIDPASNPYRDQLNDWTIVGITFDVPAVLTAQQYYIEFLGAGWAIGGLSDASPGGAYSTLGFGGGIDNASFFGASIVTVDLCACIGVVPNKPTMTSVIV